MRDILFRGKRTDNGEWVEGYYIHRPSAVGISISNPICIWIPAADPDDSTKIFEVSTETVCQYTGLTDKNGRKIFEGDIVERGGRIWLVEYSNNYGQFIMKAYTEKGISWSRSFDLIPPDWCEIIGNIYDNPELLEVKQNEM